MSSALLCGCRKKFLSLNKAIALQACLLILPFTGLQSYAYVLQGPHVIQLMLDRLSLPQRLFISQKLVLFDPDPDVQGSGFSETVQYRLPEQYRSDIQTPELSRIYIESADTSLTVLDGRVMSKTDSWMDHYKDLFFYRSRERLVARLNSTGIDVSTTSLGRFEKKIAFVIGAQYPDESVPQLWIDKETFQPMRWVFRPGDTLSGKESLEIRYVDWQDYNHVRYPIRIDFLKGQRTIRRIRVERMEINPGLSKALFDIELVKGAYTQEAVKKFPESEKSDIEKKIEDFRKIFE